MKVLILSTFLFIVSVIQALPADWKYFGGVTTPNGITALAFYDSETIKYPDSGNVIVWTKMINESEVKRMSSNKDIIEKSAKKLVVGYYPPYALYGPEVSYDNIIDIIASEELANNPNTKTTTSILYEIDCKATKMRNLSGIIYDKKGHVISRSDAPGNWSYNIPETNGEMLQKILCKK